MTPEQLRFIAAMTQDAGAAYSHNERALGREVAKRMHTHQVARIQAVRNLLDVLDEAVGFIDMHGHPWYRSDKALLERLNLARSEVQECGK